MYSFIQTEKFAQTEVHLWPDSRNVLHWIYGIPARWPTFITNRCGEIATLFLPAYWHHMRTHENPADWSSRDCKVSEIQYLENIESTVSCKDDIYEEETTLCQQIEPGTKFIIHRYSSVTRALRITVLILKFVYNTSTNHRSKMSQLICKFRPNYTFITYRKLKSALKVLCRIEQVK